MYTKRQPRIERICPTCGKSFLALASEVRRGNGTYCGKACFGSSAERVCPMCHKVFRVPASELARGSGIYCGIACGAIGRTKPLAERFWKKVKKTKDCWLWTGATTSWGYGTIGRGKTGTNAPAHRVSWELHHGPIPDGLCILHHCDNPSCVRPDHLFLGTLKDNTQDMLKKGRHRVPRGEAKTNAKLTWEIVANIRLFYAQENVTLAQLAEQHHVSGTTIFHIVHNKKWRQPR